VLPEGCLDWRGISGYAVAMRFRPKFGLFETYTLIGGVFCLSAFVKAWFFHANYHFSIWEGLEGTLFILSSLYLVLNRFLVYWEIDSTGLRARTFWIVSKIAWIEVTRVCGYPSERPSSDSVQVEYMGGQIVANPEDRFAFISALRRFAPEAEFEV
jgi:hypothetical protein